MCPKAQHAVAYRKLPLLLRNLREAAGFTQRELGKRMGKPQSWIYNCETANRRVGVTEFILWCRACEANPETTFQELVEELQ